MTDHDRPESAITMLRNTHSTTKSGITGTTVSVTSPHLDGLPFGQVRPRFDRLLNASRLDPG